MKIQFNADPADILSSKKRNILFVHVGKCAGETIMHALLNQLSDEFAMYEMHVYDANIRIAEVVKANPEGLIYLVAKRDPVARYVSSFNWDKHNLFLKGTLKGTRCEDFYHRFPSVNALLSGLSAADPVDRLMAEEFSRFAHMGMGQAWYTPSEVLDQLPIDRTFFLDVATLRRDLMSVLNALGNPVTDADWQPPSLKSRFGDEYHNPAELFSTFLSDKNRATLERHISKDFSIYERMKTFKISV